MFFYVGGRDCEGFAPVERFSFVCEMRSMMLMVVSFGEGALRCLFPRSRARSLLVAADENFENPPLLYRALPLLQLETNDGSAGPHIWGHQSTLTW